MSHQNSQRLIIVNQNDSVDWSLLLTDCQDCNSNINLKWKVTNLIINRTLDILFIKSDLTINQFHFAVLQLTPWSMTVMKVRQKYWAASATNFSLSNNPQQNKANLCCTALTEWQLTLKSPWNQNKQFLFLWKYRSVYYK